MNMTVQRSWQVLFQCIVEKTRYGYYELKYLTTGTDDKPETVFVPTSEEFHFFKSYRHTGTRILEVTD